MPLTCEYRDCQEPARLSVAFGGEDIPSVLYCRKHSRVVARLFHVDAAKLVHRDPIPRPRTKEPEAPFLTVA